MGSVSEMLGPLSPRPAARGFGSWAGVCGGESGPPHNGWLVGPWIPSSLLPVRFPELKANDFFITGALLMLAHINHQEVANHNDPNLSSEVSLTPECLSCC